MKIIQIGQDGGIQKWLENLGHDVKIVDGLGADLEKVYTPDLVVFTGGSDVSPFLYNQTNTHSHSDARRDLTEIAWYHKFYSVPKLGICRGGQFLHVMNGGEMVQDISRHAISGEHDCKFWNRDAPYQVTSTHHQMMKMRPDTPAIAYANLNGNKEREAECQYYGQSKSMCFQPHPEYEKVNPATGLYPARGTNALLRVCYGDIGVASVYGKNYKFDEPVQPKPAAKLQPVNMEWRDIAFQQPGFLQQARAALNNGGEPGVIVVDEAHNIEPKDIEDEEPFIEEHNEEEVDEEGDVA